MSLLYGAELLRHELFDVRGDGLLLLVVESILDADKAVLPQVAIVLVLGEGEGLLQVFLRDEVLASRARNLSLMRNSHLDWDYNLMFKKRENDSLMPRSHAPRGEQPPALDHL